VKRVFIITPSYLMKRKRDFAAGIAQLSKLGFQVVNPDFPEVLLSPREKAEQIHQAFTDPAVDIILALRGGYSAMKSLPFLDFELIRRHPKVFAGFSDLTALLNPIHERTGNVTLHSPMVTNLKDATELTLSSFMNAIHGFPEKNLFLGAPVKVYHRGVATGVLKGGNLVTLTALFNTPWETDVADCILFLEDVDEKLHKIDRLLTQWMLAGKLNRVKGLILGDFAGLNIRRIQQVIASQMELTFPVVHCPYLGHAAEMITLPVGAEVELNAGHKQLLIKNATFPGAKP
jgi:muramoyltetrapeptide carboxypeptidase